MSKISADGDFRFYRFMPAIGFILISVLSTVKIEISITKSNFNKSNILQSVSPKTSAPVSRAVQALTFPF